MPLGLVLLFDCSKNTQLKDSSRDEPVLFEKQSPRLPLDLSVLSADDACVVAKLFVNNNPPTKMCHNKEVIGVVPVLGDDDCVLMYAVNLTDGYILVSATTDYYPILAIVEHGSFSILPNSGQEYILEDLKTVVSSSKDSPALGASAAWREYMDQPSFEVADTKVSADYYALLDSYIAGWIEDGRAIYYLKSKPDSMPDDIYERFCQDACDDTPYFYPYMDCAIITEKYVTKRTGHGPLLHTQWEQSGQGSGGGLSFNYFVPNMMDLGCVTVAVGQIMRFFEYPVRYNWAVMPNNTSNIELSSFLAALRTDLCVNNSGATTASNARDTFRHYGYNASLENHSAENVCSSLNRNRPVFMSGTDDENNVGHSWVCDGYYSTQCYYEYKLYIPRVINGRLYDFIEWGSESVYDYFSPVFYHMNWGWGGDHDGYYMEESVKIVAPDFSRNYISHRKEIIVVPNN